MGILEHKVLVIGLPGTGKTTFLAALWDVVGSGEVEGALQLERLSGDKQHLNEIRDLWADCNKIPRTRLPNERIVSMALRDSQTNACSEVFFPDMDGESFEHQWTERVWTTEYEKLVAESSGALLFVHPATVNEAALIRDAQPLIKRIAEEPGREAGTRAEEKEELTGQQAVAYEPRYAATQVQLVELLQLIRMRQPQGADFRIGVIVSAWDIVLKLGKMTPEAWLETRLPLLNQYLHASTDIVPFRIYGVSAQGGELSEAQKIRKSHRSSDRIVVTCGQQTSHDITVPVRWIMAIPDA